MFEKIKNDFLDLTPDYKCFGCSPSNDIGLKLEFFKNKETGEVFTTWIPDERFAGYTNIVHGGIQATLLDETFGWLIHTHCCLAVTMNLSVDYLKQFRISDGEVTVVTKVISQDEKDLCVEGCIKSKNGVILTKATGKFRKIPEKLIKKMTGQK